ncbi:tetratricopeptide repeat protein [Wolbachia endosymbiont (group A) of Philonthus cognatus]|uniref:tetratricopeptide repeat protein n=1 Tax=Wolbachia endosymbiont (group A) of Philonthus cognatus TaxID=2954046 RepID=UPI0022323BB9|nr:tetratricopeptide repeat protein [Wolbachia endosymbiont (group A) of Philonthus cognatus]
MNVENKQSEVLSNRTFKKRDGTSTGDHGRKYEVKLLMLYLLHGLSSKIDFWLASNMEAFGAFDDIFFEYKDQKNKSRIILVQAKHCNTHRSSKNITFEDLFIDGNDRKQQKEDFGLNKYFESHPEIKQNPECKNSDITLVIHTNVNVNLKKGTEKQGSVETLEKYLEESKLTNDNTLNIYEGQKGTCYKIKNHTELKKYFSCGSDDEIEDFLLRIRFVVDQPNHSKLDDIIKKEIGNIYKISGEEDIDTVFVRVFDKVEKWWAQKGSKVSYLTRKDDYFREAIEHLYSLKPREDLFERWNIPPKIASGNFIEREYLNEEIVNHLKTKNEPVILTALYGLGGVGKTQSVLDFIQKHGKEYKAICWFNAKDEDQLLSEYVNLGRKLNIIHDEDNISIAQRAYYVKNWLEDSKREGWLLIYDNVSNYEVISKLRPTKGGKIIVTSRNTEWPQGSIGVDVFTPPESELYVKKILGQVSESDRPNIGILAEKLGRLPLALAQACAYIKENKMTISRYLEIYAERKLYLLSHKTLPKDSNHEPVFITWDITMDAIRNESKLASKLLVACAYLDNDIPKDLLRIFPEIVENNSEEKPFEEVLGILLRYSMLVSNEQSSSVSIHCLVQDVIRLKSKESGKIKKDIKTVFQLLKESFPDDSDKLEDYAKKRQLLPHLETFLSHIDDWLGKNPLEKQTIEKDYLVDLLIRMSDGYYYLGNPRRQKESLERVLPIFRKHYGSDHFIVATALTNLGIACGDLGDHKKKKTLLERALPISEKHYGPDHFEVAAILTNLSSSYGTLGNHDKQKELLERTLTIKEKHYGPDHFEVARTLANLGNSYRALGTPQKAKELLERALPVLKKHYSPDHPEVAIPLANLGIAYGASGNHEKKRSCLCGL